MSLFALRFDQEQDNDEVAWEIQKVREAGEKKSFLMVPLRPYPPPLVLYGTSPSSDKNGFLNGTAFTPTPLRNGAAIEKE